MPSPRHSIVVATAAQAAARDRAAIAGGMESFSLMANAGTATVAMIVRDCADKLADGVAIFAGPGNNGGDAYVVAAQLARAGVRVRLHAAEPPRTDDAIRAAAIAAPSLIHGAPTGNEQLAIDGLLGTGHRGTLRASVLQACERLRLFLDRNATIVALDVPTGLDATTGDISAESVPAHITVSYGTFKRAHVVARHHVGRVVLVDIGLNGTVMPEDNAWHLAEQGMLHPQIVPVAWNSWKTRRGVVALAGGDAGMAGAIVLSARGALATGVGLAHCIVQRASVSAVQISVPQAIAHSCDDDMSGLVAACDALAVGPGLGRGERSRALLADLTSRFERSLLLDADALTLIATSGGRRSAEVLADIAGDRQVVCTPHPREFAALIGSDVPSAIDERVELLQSFAITSRCTVLLKGTPTVICSPDGAAPVVAARGTPALATGGSGDMLTGIIAALLAQRMSGVAAASTGAWLHGRAAEIASRDAGTVRGVSLDAVAAKLPYAWRELEQPATFPVSVLGELPSVMQVFG